MFSSSNKNSLVALTEDDMLHILEIGYRLSLDNQDFGKILTQMHAYYFELQKYGGASENTCSSQLSAHYEALQNYLFPQGDNPQLN